MPFTFEYLQHQPKQRQTLCHPQIRKVLVTIVRYIFPLFLGKRRGNLVIIFCGQLEMFGLIFLFSLFQQQTHEGNLKDFWSNATGINPVFLECFLVFCNEISPKTVKENRLEQQVETPLVCHLLLKKKYVWPKTSDSPFCIKDDAHAHSKNPAKTKRRFLLSLDHQGQQNFETYR